MSEEQARHLQDRMDAGAWAIAHRLTDNFEQAVVEQALTQEGIEFETRLSFETAFSFIFEMDHGFGVVIVPAADVDRAKELIAAILAEDEHAAEAAAREAESSVADEEAPVG